MSPYVKLTLCAATLATTDAGLSGQTAILERASAMLGSTHGSSSYCHDYYEQIVREGVLLANPMLFAEGVPNAAAAQLSLMLGLKGSCQTIIGTRTAGLDALRLASMRIRAGDADAILISAAEEMHYSIDGAYENCGLQSKSGMTPAFNDQNGFVSRPSAVSLWLESSASAKSRGAKPLAKLGEARSFHDVRENLPRTLSHLLASLPQTPGIICSANTTWLDRVELGALKRLEREISVGCAYDHLAETFSATPLLAIAGALLTGELPRPVKPPESGKMLRFSTTGRPCDRFISICTDWEGTAAGVVVECLAREQPS